MAGYVELARGERTKPDCGRSKPKSREMETLEADLSAADAIVRARAADRLGLIGEAAAGSAAKLAALVSDAAEDAGLNAAYALGRIGRAGTEALLGLMKHGSKRRRSARHTGFKPRAHLPCPASSKRSGKRRRTAGDSRLSCSA